MLSRAGESQSFAPSTPPGICAAQPTWDAVTGVAARIRLPGSTRAFSKEMRDIVPMITPKHLLVLLLLSPDLVIADTHPCAERVDPRARLTCYDEAFPPREAAPANAPVRSEAERIQEFGLTQRAVEESKPAAEREQTIDRVEARVIEVRTIQWGQRLLTLDNGHIWQVTDGGSRGFLKAGDRVTIRRALMGSHILSTPGGVGLRVRRVN